MGKGSEQTFYPRWYANGQQVHEKVLNVTNTCQKRYYQTLVRKALIKKTRDNKYQGGSGKKETLVYLWVEM